MAGVKNVCFIGAGFVVSQGSHATLPVADYEKGGPSGAILACKNPDVEVNIVDLSSERIAGVCMVHTLLLRPMLNQPSSSMEQRPPSNL